MKSKKQLKDKMKIKKTRGKDRRRKREIQRSRNVVLCTKDEDINYITIIKKIRVCFYYTSKMYYLVKKTCTRIRHTTQKKINFFSLIKCIWP